MRGFDAFMKNPNWKRIYDNAPTELLKEYYRLKFDAHPYYCDVPEEEMNRREKLLTAKFTKVEWQYLLDTTPILTAKIYYKKMLEAAE